jgi:hypothetical protein
MVLAAYRAYLVPYAASIWSSISWSASTKVKTYGIFKNQGDCVSFVETHGKNPPSGP